METFIKTLIILLAVVAALFVIFVKIPYCLIYHGMTPMYEAPLICR